MKNLSDKNKRWLTIAGLGVVCIALVIAISSQFKTEKPKDNLVAPSSTATVKVNPSTDVSNPAGGKNVVIQASEPTTTSTETPNTADSTGTEQTIQPDPVKPEAPKETPKPQGETTNPSKAPTYKPEDTTVSKPAVPKGGEEKDGKVYLPGFGWVTETGGSGTTVDGGGDINKQVGQMN
jgi:cytoskeletal protein RodZ